MNGVIPATYSTAWDIEVETVANDRTKLRVQFREGECWGYSKKFDRWFPFSDFNADSADEMEALIVTDKKWHIIRRLDVA